jgi:chromosome segregation ATPase
MNPISPIPADVRERIVKAAAELFEQAGHQTFPPVDRVRRLARVDMNAASAVMREWRREQTARAAPVAVQVPDAVVQAGNQALATLWTQAQQLANESLQATQAAWEVERAELDTLRHELSSAFEAQAGELELLRAQGLAAEQAHQEATRRAAAELRESQTALASALTRAERAEAQAGAIERRADDLGTELGRVHEQAQAERARHAAELAALKAAADAQTERHAAQRQLAAQETHRLAERMTQAEAGRDQARQEAAQAREQAARLQGHVDALQMQQAERLRAVGGTAQPAAPAKKPPGK